MRISFVVCMSKNRVIGRKGGMPWRMSSDLKHFRAVTLGKPVIMGRKTFDSIGKPLDGRINYVVSRQAGLTIPGAVVVPTVAAALDMERAKGTAEAIIGGGGEIWRQSLALADRIYLTELDATIDDGDTVFPDLDPAHWKATSRVPLATGAKDDYAADIIVYDRIA
jgi:dihydrofolate reductase